MANIAENLAKILSSRYGKDVRQAIHDSISDINDIAEGQEQTIEGHIADAEAWAKGTKDGTPVESTDPQYHNNAKYFSDEAASSATSALNSANAAAGSATTADNKSKDSEAWAVGQRSGADVPSTDPTYENNAKYWQAMANYWYLQAKAIAEGLAGALIPMGTVNFVNLPSLASVQDGWMYNISDSFTTTSDFKEGSGHVIPEGSNVYKTGDGKWDVLAGSPVSGVKGSAEANYRTGNVDITPTNIGLGNVDNESITPLKSNISWYGTCSTDAATTAKIATSADSKFSLVTGAKVRIKFTYTNTASAPTLNVDSKGVKSIKAYGTTAPTIWWNAGDVVDFTYDGTNWIMGATQGEIEQIKSDLNKGEVSVTGDGTKTYTQLLNELYALVDRTKLDGKSYFIGAYGLVAKINGIQTSYIGFNSTDVELSALKSTSIGLKPTASFAYSFNGTTATDNSSSVVTSGTVLKVVY